MSFIPLSVLDRTAANALSSVLHHHVPLGASILDPCCGESIWWDPRTLSAYHVTRCDILPPYNQDLFTLAEDQPEYVGAFDCVVYDPPYFVGVGPEGDKRQASYGGYRETEDSLLRLMSATHDPITRLLKSNGKIVVKCQDQFSMEDRKLHLRHVEWLRSLCKDYEVVDFFVQRGHRINPQAYQVKDRPCSIIVHSYLIVGQLR